MVVFQKILGKDYKARHRFFATKKDIVIVLLAKAIICSQAQRLQNYVEQFKNNQIEVTVRSEVGKILLDSEKLLQNALVSVVVALRNDPNRHLLIDRMELTPFSTIRFIFSVKTITIMLTRR